MLGSVAQVIALTAYGNAVLGGAAPPGPDAFYPSNSAFQYCEYVQFVDVSDRASNGKEIPWAADPVAWFGRLKSEKVRALRLHYVSTAAENADKNLPDRMGAGFVGGGGRWLLEAVTPEGSDYWEARWVVGDQNRADRKIWRVTYGRVARNRPIPGVPAEDIEKLKYELSGALQQIDKFARSHNLSEFAKMFERSQAQLSSTTPEQGVYHKDLLSQGHASLPVQQLLWASQIGWVFGGMGSWNDVGDDSPEYERVSEKLFQTLNRAYAAVANSTVPPDFQKPKRTAGLLDTFLAFFRQ